MGRDSRERIRKPLLYPAELRDPQSDINTLTHQPSEQNGTLPPTYQCVRLARNVNARRGNRVNVGSVMQVKGRGDVFAEQLKS
jgi:hypothetical protein